ncbi:MAG TPA: class I SAM-dependent methyltransferase [Kofleriaceae bacterium]|nr:class I SAM-dependent methyltransferase [Kofleriaceae bacterium]
MDDQFGPEVSDVIVDYDASTLARRDVLKDRALAALAQSPAIARRLARNLSATADGHIVRSEVDGILIRSHLELQRLHEEFRIAPMMRDLLRPLIALAREATGRKRIRIVDLGCGMGFIVRWLAANGELGADRGDVELIGADYNLALLEAAKRLATDEMLPVRFVAANAFELDDAPADIVMSTGVLHHFRGTSLDDLFANHERSSAVAFLHADIRPSVVAPPGSWVFHRARMREPLAKFDGYWSAVRAHDAQTLRKSIASSAPGFALGLVDAKITSVLALLRIFQVAVAVRRPHVASLAQSYKHLGRRFEVVA